MDDMADFNSNDINAAVSQSAGIKQQAPLEITITGGSSDKPVNNPGNMRVPGSSTKFQQFDTPEAGSAAIDKQLSIYQKRGINTLGDIISTWSPPNENKTANLIANASKLTWVDPNAQLDVTGNPYHMQLVKHAILTQEGAKPQQVSYKQPIDDPMADFSSSSIDKEVRSSQPTVTEQMQQQPSDSATSSQPWSNVASSALKNLPASAINFGKNIVNAVSHPIDAASSLLDVGAGELQKLTPAPVENLINKLDWNKPAAQRAENAATNVNQFYKDRYGSVEGIKNSIATDPVGVASDASALLGIGGSAAGLAKLGKTSDVLNAAAKVINPLTLPIMGASKLAETAGSSLLGLTTGVGAENIRHAFVSGMKGDTSFWDNLTGKASFGDVLDSAKQNLQNMGAQKSAEYRAGMANISNDKSVLDFNGIDNSVANANDAVTFNGQIKNARGAQIVQEMSDTINHWKSLDPATFHTPEGLDALKQKIGGILEGIPYNEKTALMAGNKIYNGIKSSIVDQAPTYADVMKNYSEATDQINEIQKALSLNNHASADTAIRKLQSLTRNNVNTNYGSRLTLAKQLEQQGGNEMLPAISGQAMNSLMPRGLAGQLGSLGSLGAGYLANPAAFAALPLQSPKIVGAALYGAGKAAGAAKKVGINPQTLIYLNAIGRPTNAPNP